RESEALAPIKSGVFQQHPPFQHDERPTLVAHSWRFSRKTEACPEQNVPISDEASAALDSPDQSNRSSRVKLLRCGLETPRKFSDAEPHNRGATAQGGTWRRIMSPRPVKVR
ncbi:hypothetical protein, partial [Palleronia sp.]|uniref:hypothetical protein n=1 Tax=Palleronia sp. TaxID=1940284 RepID=UPI0035C87A3D